MFELAIWTSVMWMSVAMVTDNYSTVLVVSCLGDIETIWGSPTNGGNAYHDRNATMNPSQEKKNTRPY